MVYKKYIKKNGRLYGPYVYHSRRVNGKVISEYHGQTEDTSSNFSSRRKSLKGIFIFGLLFLLLVILFYGVKYINDNFNESIIVGNVVQESQATFYENQTLQSEVIFKLKGGEFIPYDSDIVVETASGTKYSYPLNELVDNEIKENGSFYVEGKNLQGSGSGYGVKSVGRVFVPLTFVVEIYETQIEEVVEENVPDSELIVEEPPVLEENVSDSEESVVEEEIIEEPIVVDSEEINSTNSISGAVVSEENVNFIMKFFGGVITFFDNLGLTGESVDDINVVLVEEVIGQINEDGVWTYELEESQSAELKSGSVEYDMISVEDDYIELELIDGVVSAVSSYYEDVEGYGENYLSEDVSEEIVINLTKLSISSEKGELKIGLFYEGVELVSDVLILESDGVIVGSVEEVIEIPELPEINITINESEVNVSVVNVTKIFLSEEELNLLKSRFGNSSLKTTKAEVLNGRIALRYELGDYWVEYSYEGESVNDLNKDELERDRIKWLKDLAKKINEDLVEDEPEEILELLEDVSIEESVNVSS